MPPYCCSQPSTCHNPVWCWSSVSPHSYSQPLHLPKTSVLLVQSMSPYCCSQPSTCLNPVYYRSVVCPYRVIVNLLQPSSNHFTVGPVYVPCINAVCCWSSMCLQNYCQPTSTCLNPGWCWSSLGPHGTILTYFNLPQPIVMLVQCVHCLNPVLYWSSVCYTEL